MKKTSSASAAVMTMWLVTVKVNGMIPTTLEKEHEHEKREHQRKEAHAFLAGGVAQSARDQFVDEFRHRLQARRHQMPSGGRPKEKQRRQANRDQHEDGRVGQMNFSASDLEQPEQILDFKLMDRIGGGVHVDVCAGPGNLSASNSVRPARRPNASS